MPEDAAAWVLTGAAGLSCFIWFYLLLFHHRFWRADQRLDNTAPAPETWPAVTAVVPARDEAPYIGQAVRSLLTQDYPGRLTVIVVDDGSRDGTAEVAKAAAAEADAASQLTVVPGTPLPEGWTGKMWAVATGVRHVPDDAEFILLTDADVAHDPGNVRRLAAKAVCEERDLVSLMVRLKCRSFWERLLIPAFVFFFQKLYPFPAVNDPKRRMAGAAGGCMLVRRTALDAAGGIEAISSALIDDCALARRLKARGSIWLGLTHSTRSLRPYDGLGGIWRMVARTAFTQLDHSVLLLLGTVLGMAVIYLAPVAALGAGLVMGQWIAAGLGGATLLLMILAYWPTARLYGPPWPEVLLLPLAGLLYTLMTLDSARRHWTGGGGAWKGRTYRAATPYGGN